MLPLLFAKNIAIRRPTIDEQQRMINKLLIDGDESSISEDIFKLTDKKEEVYSFVLESKSAINNESNIYGAITYSYSHKKSQKICRIGSLKIHPKYHGLKFGSLLLDSVLLEAKKKGCKSVELTSTDEGFPLYLSVGFVPELLDLNFEEVSLNGWWDTLSLEEQVKGLSVYDDVDLLLIFEIEKYSEKVFNHLQKALNFLKKEPSSPLRLDHVKIHPLFFEKGILDLMEIEREASRSAHHHTSSHSDEQQHRSLEEETSRDPHLSRMDFEAYEKEYNREMQVSTDKMDNNADEFDEFLKEHDKRYPADDLDLFGEWDDDIQMDYFNSQD